MRQKLIIHTYIYNFYHIIPHFLRSEFTERWIEPLAETTRFQQKVDKIATLKCVYSRANAKVRWYKDRKELFSGGLKYKILIEKQTISLVINNPDPEDTGRYTV